MTAGRVAGVLLVVAASVALFLVVEGIRTAPTRGALRSYTALITAANAGDLAAAGRLYSRRYRAAYPPRLAAEGGIVGLPRGIHKNFSAWRDGADVWLCPTNRAGPVYRFRFEDRAWKFDGLVGLLDAGGEVRPGAEAEAQ